MTASPRVGFDALFFEQPMTGAGQYATHLWRALSDGQTGVEPVLLMPADAPDAFAVTAEGRLVHGAMPLRRLPAKARKLYWEQIGLPAATRRSGVRLVHVPYLAAPLLQRVPHVVTVHDVIPLALPDYAGSRQMRGYLRLIGRAVRRAALILTDSEFSKADIVARLGIDPARIRVTLLAAHDDMTPARTPADEAAVEETLARFGIAWPFVLNIGGYDVRKRLPALVRGFARALPSLPEGCVLVIAGRPHTGNAQLYPSLDGLIDGLGLRGRVVQTGFVSESDKINLYRACTVFAFTSAYEGFGLNPLEAMACGAPVVCSNRTSLPEVVGNAGLLIDPEPEAIGRALVAVCADPALRADLAARSLRQAARFSWRRTAEQTAEAYREVLDGGGRCAS
ncbi:MAG TPA: glycosyltransferase family 1 protein [Thermomicrobiales bacterium]|nr:glycosyltransferase family 1 protein [Thermomicrobiales bacterium]